MRLSSKKFTRGFRRERQGECMNRKQKKMLIRILVAAAMMVGLNFVPVAGAARLAAYLAAYLIIGYDILRKAGRGILNGTGV